MQRDFKPNTSREMESGICQKYQRFYQRQRLAFATMITNYLGQFGPDLLQFLWNLAEHCAQTMSGFYLDEYPQSSAPTTQQTSKYRKVRGQKYNENRQKNAHLLRHNNSHLWNFFQLGLSPRDTKWFEQLGQLVSHYPQI